MLKFLYIVVSAMIVENLIFARGLETSKLIDKVSSYNKVITFGILSTIISTLSGGLSWILLNLFAGKITGFFAKNMLIMSCIVIVYAVMLVVISKYPQAGIKPSDNTLVSVAFSGGVLGTVILSIALKLSLPLTMGYCFGATVGMTAAMMLIHSGRQRMSFSNVPKAFEGMPITLIYIGILSLAIYGLLGHQVPT